MSCKLTQINEAISKLTTNKSERAAQAISDLKGVRKQLLSITSDVVDLKERQVSVVNVVNAKMQEDPEFSKLQEELIAVKEGKQAAIDRQQKAFANLKAKGGKGRAQSTAKALAERIMLKEQLVEDIEFLRQELDDYPSKTVQKELDKTIEHLELVEGHIQENKNTKKSSLARATREKNAVAKVQAAKEAQLYLYDQIREFKQNYNTNKGILANKLSDKARGQVKLFKDLTLGSYVDIKTPNNSLALVDHKSDSVFSDMVNAVAVSGGTLPHVAESFRLMDYTEGYIQKYVFDNLREGIKEFDAKEASSGKGYQGISSLIYESVEGTGDLKYDKQLKKLPNHVATAMAVAINDWIANNNSNRWEQRTDEDVNRFLGRSSGTRVTPKDRKGIEGIDFLKTTVAQSIGANIISSLGITTNDHKYSGILKDKLAVELGLVAMQAMENEGLVTFDKRSKKEIYGENAKDEGHLDFITFTDKTKKMVDHKSKTFQKAADTSSKAFGSVNKSSKPRMRKHATPREHVNNSAQGKWLTTPKKVQGILNKVENTAFKWDEDYVLDILNSYLEDPEGTREFFGWKDISSVHTTKRKSAEGRNKAIERELDNMATLYKSMAENGNEEMFFDYFYGKNGRLYLDSSEFNPQNTKLHRFAVFTQSAKISSKEDIEMYKLALLQAFGMDIDKQTLDTSQDQWNELLPLLDKQITDEKSAIDIAKKLKNIKFRDKAIKGHDPEHMIAGINEFRRLQKHGIDNIKGIESHLPLEVDAVTSGYILKTLQMPLISEYDKHIEAGGVFTKKGDKYAFKSFGEQVEDENTLDAYLRPAKVMIDKVTKLYAEKGSKDPTVLMAELALNKRISTLKKDLESSDTKIRDNALKQFRNLMKPPFMVFNYGAGMNAIIESIIYGDSKSDGAVENFYKLVMKAADGNQASIDFVKKYIRASATSHRYDSKKKVWEVFKEDTRKIDDEIAKFEDAINTPNTTDKDGNTINAGYNYELRTDLMDNLISSLKSGLGVSLNEVFEATYAENIAANKTLNNSFTSMFRIFKAKLDRDIASRQGELGRDLTSEEYDAVVEGLSDQLPAIKHALAEESSDKLMIFNEAKQNYEALEGSSIDGQGNVRDSNKDVSAYASKYALVEAGAAGAVIPIHFLDASIMTNTLEGTDALNVFDAIMTLPGEAKQVAQDYNKHTIELNRDYSITEEMLNEFTKAIETADKTTLEAANTMMGTDETVQQALSDLADLNRLSQEGRTELFSKDILSEHLAIPGGAVEVKAIKTVLGSSATANEYQHPLETNSATMSDKMEVEGVNGSFIAAEVAKNTNKIKKCK